MKNILHSLKSAFYSRSLEIKEAPRFEVWFNEMYPKDKFNPQMDDFGKTILKFKQDQKRKLTQINSHSQSF